MVNEDTKRAICHEVGHAVVALHFGFEVERIAITNGYPHLMIRGFDSALRTAQERYTFLAGGIVGEEFFCHSYNQQTMRLDQDMISERGGGPIGNYLPHALNILRLNETRLTRLRNQLTLRWVSAASEASFDSDPNSFTLLSQPELELIWRET